MHTHLFQIFSYIDRCPHTHTHITINQAFKAYRNAQKISSAPAVTCHLLATES